MIIDELTRHQQTNLSNQRPGWVELAHAKLDRAVLDSQFSSIQDALKEAQVSTTINIGWWRGSLQHYTL